jgi:hypothetical protein
MELKTIITILQSIVLVPVFVFVAYVGFWVTMLSGPLIIGGLFFALIFWGVKEWKNGELNDSG